MRRLFLTASVAAILLAPLAPAAQPVTPAGVGSGAKVYVPPIDFRQRTLANGLKVVTAQDRTTSNVSVQVWYGVGAKNDPPGRSGFAHLFEHMMFKASRDMPAEYMDRLTEDVGGFNNASTDDDFTNYYEVVPANHLQRLLWAEADRMGSLLVQEPTFRSERDVVKEELRQRVLADPYGRLFSLALPQATYKVHPYKRPPIGSIADLDAATIADVQAFHATYYRPDDAALVVVGNFDPGQLDAWVDQYFGPLKTPAAPLPKVTAVEPPRTGPGVYDASGPNVPLPAVAITWLAPARSSGDAPALRIADAILSTGEASRLNEALVYRTQVARSAFSQADLRQQPGAFIVGAILSDGKTIEQGERALRDEVARLREAPVSPEELARAKNQLVTSALRQLETVDQRGNALGFSWAVEGDPARANDDIARLQAVTAADVQRVARQYLPDDRRMTVRYQSQAAAPAAAKPSPAQPSPAADAPQPTAAKAPQQPEIRPSPPAPGAPVRSTPPQAVERTLPNGLRVIVAHSTDLPLVSVRLTVRTGAAADPLGKAGLANLTAGLLTKGAGARSATEVARDIEALGGSLSADASWDGTNIDLGVMASNLAPAMAILADVARRPTFADEEIARLKGQTLDALKVQMEDPGALAGYVSEAAVFAGTPYGHVLEGTPASLPRITRADVQALHAAWFRPDNAILVLAGDITPEQGFALAERTLGDWRRPSSAPERSTPAEPGVKPRVIVVDLPGTGQAAVQVALPAIRRNDPRYYAATVANGALGGFSGRLNAEIRIKRGLSYGAESQLQARRFVGPYIAGAQTKNETAPDVAELIRTELDRLSREAVPASELDARKAALTGNRGRALESTDGVAAVLSGYALQDVSLAEIAQYDARVLAVTPTEVETTAGEVLNPSRATVVIAGDARLFIDRLRKTYPQVEVIEAATLDLDAIGVAPSPPLAR